MLQKSLDGMATINIHSKFGEGLSSHNSEEFDHND